MNRFWCSTARWVRRSTTRPQHRGGLLRLRELHGHPREDATGRDQEIHEEFLEAGADCIETDSFGSAKPCSTSLTSPTSAMSCPGVRRRSGAGGGRVLDAREAAVRHGLDGPPRRLVTLGNTDWDTMLDSYTEQARGLIDGGAWLLIETCQDLLQVKCDQRGAGGASRARQDGGRGSDHGEHHDRAAGDDAAGLVDRGGGREQPRRSCRSGLNCATGPAG